MSDINILIKQEDGIGHGYVYYADDREDEKPYRVIMFQKRISEKNLSSEDIMAAFEDGKTYIDDVDTELEGINKFMDFYFKNELSDFNTDIIVEKELSEAYRDLLESEHSFMSITRDKTFC